MDRDDLIIAVVCVVDEAVPRGRCVRPHVENSISAAIRTPRKTWDRVH